MRIKTSVDSTRVQQLLKRVPKALEVELYNALRDIGNDHIYTMRARMARGSIGPAIGGGLVRSSTGALGRSFNYEMRRNGEVGGLGLRVFSAGNAYANVQEFGGTIRPRTARFLAVPMPAIRRGNGSVVGKYSGGPRSLMGQRGADGKPLTFVLKTKAGKLFIAERGTKGRIRFLWALVRTVTLRGGLGWFDTWRHSRPDRTARIQRAATDALRRSGR